MASAIPGLDVTELEQIDPKTLRPRMAGSPIPNAPAAPATGGMPTAGGLRRTYDAAKSAVQGAVNNPLGQTLRGAGNVAGNAVRRAGPSAVGYNVVSHLGDYKINEPDVDSSVGGTVRALADGDFQGAGRSLRKGAVEAGMSLGAGVADTLDYVVPGKAPVSTAYDRKLRSDLGSMLIGPQEMGTEATGSGAPAAVSGPAPTQPFAPSTAGAGRGSINPALRDPEKGRPDFTSALSSVPRDLPGIDSGLVYKTKDAQGNTTYSGRDVQAGASIVDGKRNLVGNLDSGNAPGPATGGMDALNREYASLRDLGAARAAADPGWGGGASGMGPSLRDIERKNAETTASSIDPRTARRGERQIDGMDKQDITTTQANAQRYGADAGLRGHMYAADQQLKGTLANANAQSLRTNMEMNMKFGQRQLMAQIYQKAGGDLAVAKKMALANGLDPQTFEQALAADQASTARTQDTQAQASDRVRADLKSFVADKDGKMAEDPSGSQAKFDAIRQVFPGITGTDPAYYDQHSPKIKSLAGIYDKARTMPKMGVDAINPFSTADTPLSSMPDWKGGTLTRASGLRGPLTPGIANGDYYMTTKDGRDIPLGQLDEAQVNLIREHTKTGKWHNK